MRGSQLFGSRAGFALVLIVALAPLGAAGISFSGTDVQSQFTSYSAAPVIDTPGLFTFNDSLEGATATPAAGVVTAMLFLVAQLVVDGDIKFPSEREDFLRIALLGSLASLFAALYLDRALAFFDQVRDSVLRGNIKG